MQGLEALADIALLWDVRDSATAEESRGEVRLGDRVCLSIRSFPLLLIVRHYSLLCSVARYCAPFLLAVFRCWLFAPTVALSRPRLSCPVTRPSGSAFLYIEIVMPGASPGTV